MKIIMDQTAHNAQKDSKKKLAYPCSVNKGNATLIKPKLENAHL